MTLRLYDDVDDARRSILQRGAGEAAPPAVRAALERLFGEAIEPEAAVRRILADVRARGDAAVQEWTRRIDGVTVDAAEVPRAEWQAAAGRLPADLLEALRFAAERIRAFHARQPLRSWSTGDLGGRLGQRVTALDRVGVYVPGGSAPLPSSLLMTAIPAQVAGVPEIVVATPPGKDEGRVPDIILAAAEVAGATAMYRMGGAQAIGALAYGTETIRRVDKIVGPGNLFVTLAKQQVFGVVGLDGLAGPTETVVVADDSADPEWAAADLLAQAEHDPLACAILITPSRRLAEAVQAAAGRQLEARGRAEIIAASLSTRGGIVLTADLAQAAQLADEFAPEHLCLSVAEPERWRDRIRHAGGLFVGERSFEVLGDYAAGPSHVMPTGGTARFASPLSALDFVRITSMIELDAATAGALSGPAARLAQAEQLDAHAYAAELRRDKAEAEAPLSGAIADGGQLPSHKPARVPGPSRTGQPPRSAGPSAGHPETPGSGAGRREQKIPPAPPPAALVREAVARIEPYTPILPFEVLAERLGRRPEDIVKLDANENPYGPAPRARQAVAEAPFIHIYPDPESTALRRALAEFSGVPAGRLLAGAGADELIDLILRVVIEPEDAVLDCPPSFGMYPFCAAVNAARRLAVPRRADFSVDVEAVEARARAEPRAKVLFLCSPNNPDGGVIGDEDLRRLLRLPLLVVLDEAYVEFAGESRCGWTEAHANLAVLRTFSKWAGLAGLRAGWAALPDWLMREAWKVKQPYNVNVAAEAAARASLADREWLQGNVKRITAERERLRQRLAETGVLHPYPSQANFILCRVGGGLDARRLKQSLERAGVMVRHFDKPGLQDHIRISVGRPRDSDALLRAVAQAAREG